MLRKLTHATAVVALLAASQAVQAAQEVAQPAANGGDEDLDPGPDGVNVFHG